MVFLKKINIKDYKDYKIYFYENKFLELGKNIIDKKIKIKNEIKVTKRNYVAKIEFLGDDYILKSPRNEYRIIQRKIMTLFKKGEALTTLENLTNLIEDGLDIFAKPYLVVVKREKGMIVDSFLVLECIYSGIKFSKDKTEELLRLENILYKKGIYHGDFNPSNFIYLENSIKIIDTQGKKYRFGAYRHNYDRLTMEDSIYQTYGEQNWYNKNIWFYIAYGMKKFKKLSFIKKIKKIRKNKRNEKI